MTIVVDDAIRDWNLNPLAAGIFLGEKSPIPAKLRSCIDPGVGALIRDQYRDAYKQGVDVDQLTFFHLRAHMALLGVVWGAAASLVTKDPESADILDKHKLQDVGRQMGARSSQALTNLTTVTNDTLNIIANPFLSLALPVVAEVFSEWAAEARANPEPETDQSRKETVHG